MGGTGVRGSRKKSSKRLMVIIPGKGEKRKKEKEKKEEKEKESE